MWATLYVRHRTTYYWGIECAGCTDPLKGRSPLIYGIILMTVYSMHWHICCRQQHTMSTLNITAKDLQENGKWLPIL